MKRFNMYGNEQSGEHAMCRAYGHEWKKSHTLSGRAKRNITIEVCKRCGEIRRVAEIG